MGHLIQSTKSAARQRTMIDVLNGIRLQPFHETIDQPDFLEAMD
jgi:hypothetical protein